MKDLEGGDQDPPSGQRENELIMSNERSDFRATAADGALNSAPNSPVTPQDMPAAYDNEAYSGIVSRNAPRQLNPMGKVIASVLSVLLVLTCWNSYSIEEARRMVIGDEATPMASGTGDELLDEVDDENLDQASNDAEGEGDAEEGDEGADDEADDESAEEEPAGPDAPTDEEIAAYLPENLVDADKVMPTLSDDIQAKKADGILNTASATEDELKEALAARAPFSLAVAGALRASDDAYHVAGTSLTLAPSLGNTNVTFEGGHLGGVEDADAVALTFEAPFLYQNNDGTFGTTLSEEEWKARGAAADDMRAKLAVSVLPEGWTVYTKHGEQYQKRTAEELAAGLSGTIVLRFEGVQDENGITVNDTRGQMPAGIELPVVTAWLTENTPATQPVAVRSGFALCSYVADRNEDGSRKADSVYYNYTEPAAATVTLVAAEPQLSLSTELASAADATLAGDTAWAAYLVTVKAAKGSFAEKTYALRVTDAPDTAEGAGMLSADGIVAFDATGMTADELAAVSVTKAADGVADITVHAEGTLSADALTGETDGERVIYVAVPYATANLTTTEDGTAHNPETHSFMLWSYGAGKAVQEDKVEEAEAVNDTLADEDQIGRASCRERVFRAV